MAAAERARKPAPAGFTLLETLVVMIITGLIVATLFTSFNQVIDLRLKLATFFHVIDRDVVVLDWLRKSADGMVAEQSGGPNHFVGDGRGFTGLTVAAPEASPGVPYAIQWHLSYDGSTGRTYLTYKAEDHAQIAIADWPGDTGRFLYAGDDLVWTASWPKDTGGVVVSPLLNPQVPTLIRLDAPIAFDVASVIAAPRAAKTARVTANLDAQP